MGRLDCVTIWVGVDERDLPPTAIAVNTLSILSFFRGRPDSPAASHAVAPPDLPSLPRTRLHGLHARVLTLRGGHLQKIRTSKPHQLFARIAQTKGDDRCRKLGVYIHGFVVLHSASETLDAVY